jgi:hypothetical protein
MQPASILRTGHQGPVRQRIVALDRLSKGRRTPAHLARDRYLRQFIRRAVITPEQLQDALASLRTEPSRFTWLTQADQARLAKADCIFLAEYGRFPTRDLDFQLNGEYYKICRSLAYDWRYYDKLLEQLHWDKGGQAYVRPGETVTVLKRTDTVERKRGSAWAFGFVLLAGLVGGPLATIAVFRHVSGELTSAISVFIILWLLTWAGLLGVTRPRRVRRMDLVRSCSRCARELDASQAKIGCPGCGASFAA